MVRATRSIGERFEQSRSGRVAVSVVVTVLLLAEVGAHLPPSPLGRALTGPADRVLGLAGAEQTWAVFAPNPRSISLDLEARVHFADGTRARWTLPDGPPLGANLRFYRWRKWLERVRADEERSLWEPTARWIASTFADAPSSVTRVELVRRFHADLVEDPQPPWRSFTFYVLDLDEPTP